MAGNPGLDVVKTTAVEERIRIIGATIRAKRRERGMSLRELSRRTGLSIGFLSLVERGLSSLALTSLSNVAKALDLQLANFFPSEEEEETNEVEKTTPKSGQLPYVHRASDGEQLAIISSLRTYKMLSPRAPGLVLEPIFVTMQPGDIMDEPYSHEGEEFAYVLSGELVFLIDNTEYRLGPGDSIHFRSTVSHLIRNDTDEPVQAIWVLTPRLM
jgi:transcriptional regulator with XRE-family HTH domain